MHPEEATQFYRSGTRATSCDCLWKIAFRPPGNHRRRTNRRASCLLYRCRLLRLHTRVVNHLDALAKNEGLVIRSGWSRARR
jgi:hypothetical protein